MTNKAEKWFRDVITTGLKTLVALSLPGTPAADVVSTTRNAWVVILWRAPIDWIDDDAARIERAFIRLASHIERWPPPKALLQYMASRPERLKLEEPPVSREQSAKALAGIKKMLRDVNKLGQEYK